MGKYDNLIESLVKGNVQGVSTEVQMLLDSGTGPQEIIDEALIPGMDIVGDKFKKHEYFVPQVLFAARAMHSGMDLIKPLLVGDDTARKKGTIVIGTARGDQHDIGKNLVAMMLESAGFSVIDLGTDVAPEKFVDAAKKEKADVIGISALMTTTMASMSDVVQALNEGDLGDSVKVMIGGAPVTAKFAAEIGAHGQADNATDAVDLVKNLLS